MSSQLDLWRSDFGWEYAQRNNNRITDEDQYRLVRDWGKILRHAITPPPTSVLEVGCNVGRNLVALRNYLPKVFGVDPNERVIENAKGALAGIGVTVRVADAFDLPFDDNSFDMVFTSGVLIHIDPQDLGRATDEIMRVSARYVVCIEYFSHEPVEVPYHGMDGVLFKRDFGRFYMERYPSLKVLDYGFLWSVLDSSDDSNWWLFEKRP